MTNQIQKSKFYFTKRKLRTEGKANCQNCGASLQGNFCHNCGQSIAETNKPIKEFLVDILGSLYAFDHRFWNSIKVLFTQPAKFSEGKIKDIVENKESQKQFMAKAYKNISWVMFLLMPIFALLLKILYSRRKEFYISHLIFSINTHTQIFLILTVFFLIDFNPRGLLLLFIPFFTLRGMKFFYQQSWRKTIVKFFILTSLYNLVLLAALTFVFVITLGLS